MSTPVFGAKCIFFGREARFAAQRRNQVITNVLKLAPGLSTAFSTESEAARRSVAPPLRGFCVGWATFLRRVGLNNKDCLTSEAISRIVLAAHVRFHRVH